KAVTVRDLAKNLERGPAVLGGSRQVVFTNNRILTSDPLPRASTIEAIEHLRKWDVRSERKRRLLPRATIIAERARIGWKRNHIDWRDLVDGGRRHGTNASPYLLVLGGLVGERDRQVVNDCIARLESVGPVEKIGGAVQGMGEREHRRVVLVFDDQCADSIDL